MKDEKKVQLTFLITLRLYEPIAVRSFTKSRWRRDDLEISHMRKSRISTNMLKNLQETQLNYNTWIQPNVKF